MNVTNVWTFPLRARLLREFRLPDLRNLFDGSSFRGDFLGVVACRFSLLVVEDSLVRLRLRGSL